MDNSPQDQVATGLTALQPSEPTQSASAEAPASDFIKVGLPDDVTQRVDQVDQIGEVAAALQQRAGPTDQQTFSKDTFDQAEADNLKRDFLARVAAARQSHAPKPYTPPPMTPEMIERTRAEILAGRATIAIHEQRQAFRPKPVPHPSEGTNRPILRPEDFVPNFTQGQAASNSARNL